MAVILKMWSDYNIDDHSNIDYETENNDDHIPMSTMRGCVGAMYRPFFISPLGSKREWRASICGREREREKKTV